MPPVTAFNFLLDADGGRGSCILFVKLDFVGTLSPPDSVAFVGRSALLPIAFVLRSVMPNMAEICRTKPFLELSINSWVLIEEI